MSDYLGPYLLGPNDENQGIYTGDARELAKAIPDESVDLIFTDPVYDRIDDYRWLAETASRVLSSRGSVLVFQWATFLGDTLSAMRCLIHSGIMSLYIPNRTRDTRNKVGFNKWTPCLWMSKGNARSPRAHDILQCNAFQPVYSNGRSNHQWSKSPEFFVYYVKRFNSDITVDPFTGGGTVPAVCKMLGRRWLAFEIDPDTAEMARERVRNTQLPLPGMNLPEQLEMAL